MTDIAEDIRRAVKTHSRSGDEEFEKHRAAIFGAIVKAHYELGGQNRPWAPVDTRILDINDQWLRQLAGR